jgi:carbohydrate-selective porin OprB
MNLWCIVSFSHQCTLVFYYSTLLLSQDVLKAYANAKNRLIISDYDGTLTQLQVKQFSIHIQYMHMIAVFIVSGTTFYASAYMT